ncbi:ATP-binding protein [Mycobacterium sp. OAE908]|uniref:AAA family ATPase n=1 Tax=Mycobacterium sp. OAE908 TaxID=2817899 RepID=UPI001AE999DB
MAEDALIRELSAAVERNPDAVELRLHLAELLLADGRYAEALTHCSAALTKDPAHAAALVLLQRCTAAMAAPAGEKSAFDWSAAEEQVADIIEPAFVEQSGEPDIENERDRDVLSPSDVKLADVAGMKDVKDRLDVSLLGPIRNPELMRAYKISARGGLLLYGPPGCGKTFLARAVSGELDANFYPIGIADVLSRWLGDSERAVHEIFEVARRNTPCVLFFDEVDALGMRRANLQGGSGHRTVVNSLLAEMDPATSDNSGVYVLGATNAPWDVDAALRRPGRFDRMLFVGLPDTDARMEILRIHLRDRPVAGIDLKSIASRTDGFTGADLAHICDTATQLAMADSVRSGEVRPISMSDIHAAMAEIRPSGGEWFEIARNVVEFGNRDGAYDELAKYMRRRKFR